MLSGNKIIPLEQENDMKNSKKSSEWISVTYMTVNNDIIGKRIRFDRHIDPDPKPLTPGEEGTVIDAHQYQIVVHWDSGRSLNLIPGGDEYTILN